jgi:hypothetical protein
MTEGLEIPSFIISLTPEQPNLLSEQILQLIIAY